MKFSDPKMQELFQEYDHTTKSLCIKVCDFMCEADKNTLDPKMYLILEKYEQSRDEFIAYVENKCREK